MGTRTAEEAKPLQLCRTRLTMRWAILSLIELAIKWSHNMPITFADNTDLATLYRSAQHMDVVGIACRSLLRNLFPAHVVRKKLSCSPQAIVRRLKSVREAPLFMHLRRGMTVSAYFVNPYCNYAKERAREETHGSTRSNILQGVRAVKR